MAKYIGPKCRYCRAEKQALYLKGARCLTGKCPMRKEGGLKRSGLPGKDFKARSKKMSDYGLQLREKQKLKRMYGMLEKQFKITFAEATRLPGKTGDNMIQLLERRLDNVVFRLHFASSRSQAAQLVCHGHILVNGKRVDRPSYRLNVGDEISIRQGKKQLGIVKSNLESFEKTNSTEAWLELNAADQKGKFKAIPLRSEVRDLEKINEQMVVELYSR